MDQETYSGNEQRSPAQTRQTRGDEHPVYDVWLGVGLRVQAASPAEATRRAMAWLTATLENAPPQDGLTVTAPARDLVEPVVRALQQMGSDR